MSTEDGPKQPQQGCGRTLGSADTLLGPIRPNFLWDTLIAPLRLFRMCIVPPRESNRGSTLGDATYGGEPPIQDTTIM